MRRHNANSRPAARTRRAGMTIAEIMVVVVLIGIAAAVTVPKFHVGSFRLDADARGTRLTFQHAAQVAVAKQTDVRVSVDVPGGRLRAHEDADGDAVVDDGERVTWFALERGDRFATPPAGVLRGGAGPLSGGALENADGMPTVTFRRDGSASSDLELFLTAADPARSGFRALTLAQATARTELLRWDGATWTRGTL